MQVMQSNFWVWKWRSVLNMSRLTTLVFFSIMSQTITVWGTQTGGSWIFYPSTWLWLYTRCVYCSYLYTSQNNSEYIYIYIIDIYIYTPLLYLLLCRLCSWLYIYDLPISTPFFITVFAKSYRQVLRFLFDALPTLKVGKPIQRRSYSWEIGRRSWGGFVGQKYGKVLFFVYFMWYLAWLRSCKVPRLAFCSMDAVQLCLLCCSWTLGNQASLGLVMFLEPWCCVVIGGIL